MPLTALLLAVLSGATAQEPASLPPEQATAATRHGVYDRSISASAIQGSLYGLHLRGAGLHASVGGAFVEPGRRWNWGWSLGLGLARTSTPAGLGVTDVAFDSALILGLGPLRLGAGAELRTLDVERRTSSETELRDLRIDAIAFLSVDVLRSARGTTGYAEARGQGLATRGWMAHLGAGVRF